MKKLVLMLLPICICLLFQITVSFGIDTVPPVADFTGTPVTGFPPLQVAFSDLSMNTPTAWAWDFGDGGTSTMQNPTYTYNYSGTFDVTLTVFNEAGAHTLKKAQLIYVPAN